MHVNHDVHEIAAQGFSNASEAYERARPVVPEEATSLLARKLALGPGSTLVELGAGTGKFTRELCAASAAKLIAIEPIAEMRAKFRASLPGIELLDATAESIPLEDRSVDAVVAASAFHWFDCGLAAREIHRILKPSGKLGLIWSPWDESIDWVARLSELVDRHAGDTPRYSTGKWRAELEKTGLFSPLECAEFRFGHTMDRDTVVHRVASISYIASLPDPTREWVLANVRELLKSHPETKDHAEVEFPYQSILYWCSRDSCGAGAT